MATVFTVLVDSKYSVSVGGIFCSMTFWIEDLPLLVQCQLSRFPWQSRSRPTFFDPLAISLGGLFASRSQAQHSGSLQLLVAHPAIDVSIGCTPWVNCLLKKTMLMRSSRCLRLRGISARMDCREVKAQAVG
jgi:hypothetical protein